MAKRTRRRELWRRPGREPLEVPTGRAARGLARLSEADQEMVVALVLRSGSLSAVAAAYGVSFPTIRKRMDGLIMRLRDAVRGVVDDPMGDLLYELTNRGEMKARAAVEVRDLFRKLQRKRG